MVVGVTVVPHEARGVNDQQVCTKSGSSRGHTGLFVPGWLDSGGAA